MAGLTTVTIPSDAEGGVDLEALKAACDDTGEDVQSRPEVTVSLRLEPDDAGGPDMAEIVVEDNGPAISDEAFGRMKRVSDSVKEDGLGLGLAIVAMLARRMHARLSLRSPPPGQASGFEARLSWSARGEPGA